MNRVTGVVAGLAVVVVAALSMSPAAGASNESATIFMKMDPLKGGLFK